MAYVRRISQADATGQLKDDFDFLSGAYGRNLGENQTVPCPQVYTTSTLIPAYFHFGAVQNAALTNDGKGAAETGPVPHILINFGISDASSCFY